MVPNIMSSASSAPQRLVTLPAWAEHRPFMADTRETVGLYIGSALKKMAAELGMSQAELARHVGVDVRHLTNLWNDKRAAGLPTVLSIARRMGKSLAFMAGEEASRTEVGTVDALGRVTMTATTPAGVLYLPNACGPFKAGTRLFVDPSATYQEGSWLLIVHRASKEAWIAFAEPRQGLPVLRRIGEAALYDPAHHYSVDVSARCR